VESPRGLAQTVSREAPHRLGASLQINLQINAEAGSGIEPLCEVCSPPGHILRPILRDAPGIPYRRSAWPVGPRKRDGGIPSRRPFVGGCVGKVWAAGPLRLTMLRRNAQTRGPSCSSLALVESRQASQEPLAPLRVASPHTHPSGRDLVPLVFGLEEEQWTSSS
jgi:hypothetical protein